MQLDDVRDLFAYLKTLPAVQDKSKPHDVPFPFNIRRTLGGWKFLFLDGKPFQPDPSKDAAWNRGAYLVNGPGHCAECHSPRNMLGGIIASQRFAGGPDAGRRRLRAEHHAEGPEHVARAISSSCWRPARRRTATPSAARWPRSPPTPRKLSAADRAAMATYIKSLPPVEGPKPPERK